MSYATLDGQPIVEARAGFPRVGAWTAWLRVDTAQTFAGQAVLRLGDGAFVGAVTYSAVHQACTHVRLVGGAGGLGTQLPARGYVNAPLKAPLQDMLEEAGEALSPLADAAVTGVQLRHWARVAGGVGASLWQLLARVPGAAWRFLPDGRLWVGVESWPTLAAHDDVELTAFDPSTERLTLFSLSPGVQPGVQFLGGRVSYVEHRISEADIRTDLLMEAA
jgi:hypothetical protein